MTNPAPLGGDERTPPVPEVDPLAVSPPAASVPLDGPTEPLDPTPAYDSLAAETAAPLSTPSRPLQETLLTPDADYALTPETVGTGPLAQVKAFAEQRPAVFIGAALAVGWLVGRTLLHSSDD